MNWHEVLSWVVAALVAVFGWLKHNRQKLMRVCAESVAFSQKWASPDATEKDLEDMAVGYVLSYWPNADQVLVRFLITQVCRRRKATAVAAGLPAPKKVAGKAGS